MSAELPLPTSSFVIRGGRQAPGRARAHVRSQLNGDADDALRSDAVLLVSELVANSVLHAHVDGDAALVLELTMLDDRLRIAVIDGGSALTPRLRAPDVDRPGGIGLRLVDELSAAWGVERRDNGETRVWCDVPLRPLGPVAGA